MSVMLQRWAKLYKMTPAEHALEPAIAALGERYRPQYPFWGLGCFADFALLDRHLVIEVDDPSHLKSEKITKDAERTAKLEGLGWRVVRCTNHEALTDPVRTLRRMLESESAPVGAVEASPPSSSSDPLQNGPPVAPRRSGKRQSRK